MRFVKPVDDLTKNVSDVDDLARGHAMRVL